MRLDMYSRFPCTKFPSGIVLASFPAFCWGEPENEARRVLLKSLWGLLIIAMEDI